MDLLDDFLSEPSTVKAPAPSRFKPKAKPRPQKGPSVTAEATKEQPVKSVATDSASDQAVQHVDAPKSSSITDNERAGTKESSTNDAVILESELIDGNLTAEGKKVVDSAEPGYSETVVSKSSEDGHLNVDASLGMQFPDNTIGQSSLAANLPLDVPTLNASTIQNAEDISFPDISFASTSPFLRCTQMDTDLSVPSTYQDSGYYKEATVNSDAGELWINIEEGAEGFSCLEDGDIASEAATASGQRPVKFQPKPKTQIGRKKDALELSSENQDMNGDGSIYAGELNTESGLSSARIDGNFCMNPTTSHPDNVVYEDADSWMAQNLPEQFGEHGKSLGSDALNSSDKPLDGGTVLGSEANEKGYEVNDGVSDGAHDNSNPKACDQSAPNGGENFMGNETSKKKRPRRSKKVASENDESDRKKSKTAKVPDQSTDKPSKKVPRAPRRKRCVNKALLEAPEEEIDLQRVPIKDLIILAEYKERQAKKNAAAVQPSEANER